MQTTGLRPRPHVAAPPHKSWTFQNRSPRLHHRGAESLPRRGAGIMTSGLRPQGSLESQSQLGPRHQALGCSQGAEQTPEPKACPVQASRRTKPSALPGTPHFHPRLKLIHAARPAGAWGQATWVKVLPPHQPGRVLVARVSQNLGRPARGHSGERCAVRELRGTERRVRSPAGATWISTARWWGLGSTRP